jgi:hypothetical protein
MAYIFGDGFDCYAAIADTIAGYWDTSGTFVGNTLIAGRFAGGQAVRIGGAGGTTFLTKSSGVNDGVHHLVCAHYNTGTLSGTSANLYLQLLDGVTNQCCVVFRSDGAILLTSGGPTGTTLATYTGAVSAQNTWFAFEFEVVINNTTGSFTVRKNGNTSNDFTLGSLNTRGGTANNYANKLTIGVQVSPTGFMYLDDLLWRSDAASVPFVGDIRCYTRMPASDAGVQFARSPSPATASTPAQSTTSSKAANLGIMGPFTAPYSGTIASASVSLLTGGTGNMKAAIYDATRTTVLATSNAVVNPVSGANAITFGTPLTVTKGTVYHFATDQDTTLVYNVNGAGGWSFTTTYASFPAASPTLTSGANSPVATLTITPTISAEFVNETLQDGTTSYVYDATVNDQDLYALAALTPQPASVVAVTTRAFVQKSDAGTRTGTVQIKSGGTTVAAPTLSLTTGFLWTWRTDTTNPAGGAWTAAAVDACTIGPRVIS